VPVEIVWSPLARARLREIHAFVALDKPEAARHLATRIVAVVETLKMQPHLGRAGAESGIRELVIGSTPNSILYRVRGQRVIISTIWHGAQEKMSTEGRPPHFISRIVKE
jgi:plasmid stabilization system protein ParE